MNLQQKWFQQSEKYSCRAKISQIKVQTTEKQGLSWACPGKQSFFISKYIKLGHFQGDARRCQHFGHFYVILYSNRWNTVMWPNVDCPMLSFSDFLNLVTLQYQCESQRRSLNIETSIIRPIYSVLPNKHIAFLRFFPNYVPLFETYKLINFTEFLVYSNSGLA